MAESRPSEEHENLIQQYLKENRRYISHNLDWKDLVIHYYEFTKDEVFRLRMKARTDEGEVVQLALDMIIDKTYIKNRFSALVEALREAGYSKLADILNGEKVVIHEHHRDVLKYCAKVMSEMLNPDDILDCLAARDVLSSKDVESIKNKGKMDGRANAVFELIHLLPSRTTAWFNIFIQILKENSYESLAEKVEMRAAKFNQDEMQFPSVRSAKGQILPAADSVSTGENSLYDTFTRKEIGNVLQELDEHLTHEDDVLLEEHKNDKVLITCTELCKNKHEYYCSDHKVVFCRQCHSDHDSACEVYCLKDSTGSAGRPDFTKPSTDEICALCLQLQECIKIQETHTEELRKQVDVCREAISKTKHDIEEKIESLHKQQEQEVHYQTKLSCLQAQIKLCKENLDEATRVSQQYKCASRSSAIVDRDIATIETQIVLRNGRKTIEMLRNKTKKGNETFVLNALLTDVVNDLSQVSDVTLNT